MPLLTLTTNVKIENAEEFMERLTDEVAAATGKPKSYVAVVLENNKNMSFGGTQEPCAMMKLESIGAIEGKQKDMSKQFMSLVRDQIGVSPERQYIFFCDFERKNVGYNLSSFGWICSIFMGLPKHSTIVLSFQFPLSMCDLETKFLYHAEIFIIFGTRIPAIEIVFISVKICIPLFVFWTS